MYIRANINGWHTVLKLEEGETVAEVIAYNLDEQKADFMVKALNHYGTHSDVPIMEKDPETFDGGKHLQMLKLNIKP